MKLESVRALKEEISEEIIRDAGAAARSFFLATEPPMPHAIGCGIALGARPGDFRLAIRSDNPVAAELMKERASGEADLRIVTARADRPVASPQADNRLQGSVRPLEAGAQIQIQGVNFVGTLGTTVRDSRGVYALTNSHVAADEGRTPIGTPIGQPFGNAPIGVLDRFVPFSMTSPNLIDAALVALDDTRVLWGWNAALGRNLTGWRAITPDDLGRTVWKVGRTTQARSGKITAIEIDGLSVQYDSGILRFNDQAEASGGAADFSAPGDSGSLIVDEAGEGLGLLFAGGRDSDGIDRTYMNRLALVLERLGVSLVVG